MFSYHKGSVFNVSYVCRGFAQSAPSKAVVRTITLLYFTTTDFRSATFAFKTHFMRNLNNDVIIALIEISLDVAVVRTSKQAKE